MNCIVTAGPTFEPLDEARRITNFSTGRLGCGLAKFLNDRGHSVRLLLGEQATWHAPMLSGMSEILRFSTGADLSAKLERQANHRTDAVFHVAAVSDFAFGRVWTRDCTGNLKEVTSGKFRTDIGPITAELVPTQKIIGRLRQLFPAAVIVGWKYEVVGDRQSALRLANAQIEAYQTNACVVNGPAYGAGFGLVLETGPVSHIAEREELFSALERLLQSL